MFRRLGWVVDVSVAIASISILTRLRGPFIKVKTALQVNEATPSLARCCQEEVGWEVINIHTTRTAEMHIEGSGPSQPRDILSINLEGLTDYSCIGLHLQLGYWSKKKHDLY